MPQKRSTRKKLTRRETRELDVSIGFLEGIVRRDGDYVEALQQLGDHYTRRGQFAEGLKVDEHLARLEPRDALVFYNLACSYSLTGQADLAVRALDRALSLGYRDFKWLARDPDLDGLRTHPAFGTLRDKIRKLKVNPS